MPKSTCSVAGCEKFVNGRGWCGMHYARWRRHGAVDLPTTEPRVCSVEDCGRQAVSRGWCVMHYGRWKLHRDPLADFRTHRRPCSVSGCPEMSKARGMCESHVYRNERYGDPLAGRPIHRRRDLSVAERFDQSNTAITVALVGCQLWTGRLDATGYGLFSVDGRDRRAHTWSYEQEHGPVPTGLVLDHVCHTADPSCVGGPRCLHRRCVAAHHLEPVTRQENNRRQLQRLMGAL